jgi:sigma-B regulation protein RsbU (phosphoserine phosphatase)
MLIRQKGTVDEMADSHGIPLGLYPNRKYSQSEISLSHNDQIFIYTDGIIDSKDENGMKYSVDVLKYNLVGSWFLSPVKVIEKVKKSIYSFRGNVGAVDDMTMLLIKYTHETNKSG